MKREFLGDCAIIIAGVTLLVLGVIIQLLNPAGYHGIENNLYILVAEIFIYLSILGLGIERLINDRKAGAVEIISDLIIVGAGLTLSGMFICILIREKFFMPTPEPWFIILRTVIAVTIMLLGIERLIDDAKRTNNFKC